MSEIRYTDTAYPLWLSVKYESFMNRFSEKVKASKDFMGVDIHRDGNADDYLSHEVFKDKGIDFALFYATEEGRDEMGEYLMKVGFANYTFFTPGYSVHLHHMMPIYADYRNDPGFKQWLANRKKEHNDLILVNQDSYNKIFDTINPLLDDKRILISDMCDKTKLPLPVTTIKLTDLGDGYHDFLYHFSYDMKDDVLNCDATRDDGSKVWKVKFIIKDCDDDLCKLNFKTVIVYRDEDDNIEKLLNGTISDDGSNTTITMSLWIFFFVNYFIRTLPTCYVKRTTRMNETYTVGKGTHRTTKNRIVLKNTYEVSLTHYSLKHIRHEFKCLCWGVRGHYRHLANGKTIFVKPFRKGKERNNLAAFKGKEYVV